MSISILVIDGQEPGENCHFHWTCDPDELPPPMRAAFRIKHKFFNVDLENGEELEAFGGLLVRPPREDREENGEEDEEEEEEEQDEEEFEDLLEPVREYLNAKMEGTRRIFRDDDDDRLPRFTHLITLVAS